MMQRGCGLGLPVYPSGQFCPFDIANPGRQTNLFDGHASAEQRIVGRPYGAHSAGPDHAIEPVAATHEIAVAHATLRLSHRHSRDRTGATWAEMRADVI